MSTMTVEHLYNVLISQPDSPVYLSDGRAVVGVGSWRGSYAHLSLNYATEGDTDKILDGYQLAVQLKNCRENGVSGYKGGHYEIDGDTPVWVDNYGEYTGESIVSTKVINDTIIINTEHEPY